MRQRREQKTREGEARKERLEREGEKWRGREENVIQREKHEKDRERVETEKL